jgi:hypothetical protein
MEIAPMYLVEGIPLGHDYKMHHCFKHVLKVCSGGFKVRLSSFNPGSKTHFHLDILIATRSGRLTVKRG